LIRSVSKDVTASTERTVGEPESGSREEVSGELRTARTSVVTPSYNEMGNLQPLVEEILGVFDDIGAEFTPVEIVIVDDGSIDGSRERLRELAAEHPAVVGVLLSRNFGQSAALSAGIDRARGEFIVTMDADGQNDPADIPDLLSELVEGGHDCVSGWRRDRDDPPTKTVPSRVQTSLARLTGPDIHDFGCTLKAYCGDALRDVDIYGEGHRYIPAKLYKQGYDVTEQVVNHRPRTEGETKYGLSRLLRGSVDLAFNVFWNRYSTRPLHFLGWLSLLFMSAGGAVGLYTLYLKYGGNQALLNNVPKLILAVGLVLFGFQLLTFGILAEMVTKLYYRDEPPYRVESIVTE
jgi:glycosyltransferase involved in cell wall biosynthesis